VTVAAGASHYFSFATPSDKYVGVFSRNFSVTQFEWNIDTIIGATFTPGTPIVVGNTRIGDPGGASVIARGVTGVSGGFVAQTQFISGGINQVGGAAGQGAGVLIYPPNFQALVKVTNLGAQSARGQIFIVLTEFNEDELP
jgi:hypothetical protein